MNIRCISLIRRISGISVDSTCCLHDFCRSRVCTVPKRSPIPCARGCRRAGVCIVRPLRAVCMYMKSSRCAMLQPAQRIAARPPPAFCRVLPAACPAGCRRLPVRVAGGVVWHFWHCGTRIVPGSFLLFLPLPVAPGFFALFPLPPLPGRGRPEKVTAHPLSGCAADGEYACRYSGSFPVPQRVLGLGPSHSSSRPPRANSSCGNQKLLSTRPFRRARWI